MQSDIITHGYSCGIHGCTKVTILHVAGGDMEVSSRIANDVAPSVDVLDMTHRLDVELEPKNAPLNVSTENKNGQGLKITTNLVCKTGEGKWEFLMVKEGVIMLIDGQCVLVRR